MSSDKPFANPMIVLREEFDDWAILFDPDTGNAFGLNPVSVFIWKHLDGKHSSKEIYNKLQNECEEIPNDALESIDSFIQDLVNKGLAGFEHKQD